MPATKVDDTVITSRGAEVRVDALVAGLPGQTWKRLSAGPGAHGQRLYDWARAPIRIWFPTEIACYVCYGPVGTRLRDSRPSLPG